MDMSKNALAHLQRDSTLGPLIAEHGDLTIQPAEDTFRRLIRSIISQQVSTQSATAIRTRLFDRYEITPAAILRVPPEELREVGLSRQKAEYVRNIAAAYREHGYSRDYFDGMSDREVIDELTKIKGIGIWTAKMYLMFCLGRDDVFPIEDLGIRNGMRQLYGADVSRPEMRTIADAWRPHRSTASRYIWRVIE